MRNHLYCIVCLLITNIIVSQNTQIRVVYQQTAKVEDFKDKMNNPETDPTLRETLENQIKFYESILNKTYVLKIADNQSIFEEIASLNLNTSSKYDEFMGVNIYYKNLRDNFYINKFEFNGNRFLIRDTIEKINWELHNETKKIGKYTCFKANYIKIVPNTKRQQNADGSIEWVPSEDKFRITVWYTPEIPISNGPNKLGGLPGLILEVDQDRGTIVCTEVRLNPEKLIKIKVPKGGKIYTQAEYEKEYARLVGGK